MVDMPIEIRLQDRHRRRICRAMLRRLPDWFGRLEAIETYAKNAESLQMVIAMADRSLVGFLSFRNEADQHAEIVVMAVRREWHGQGIGRLLVDRTARLAGTAGVRTLLVRTLGASHPDTNYNQTRAFYLACGFQPISETPDYWGTGVPSLLMAADLGNDRLIRRA